MHRRWRPSALTETLTIDQCDFAHHTASKEPKTRLLTLGNLDVVSAHGAVMRMGHPGTGTTFLAQCLASAACNAHSKGLCPTAMDLLNPRIAAEAAHALFQQLHHDATPALLVCDEWGSLSLGHQGSHRFFQVISQRHQRHSTGMTTHWPCADWGKVLDSTTVATAIADRLVHNSEVVMLGGTRYRRKLTEHQPRRTTAGKEVVPSPSRPPIPLCCRSAHDNKAPLRPHDALAYFSTADVGLLCDRW